MSPGAYLDATIACLGGGLDDLGKAKWLLTVTDAGSLWLPMTRLERIMVGQGVYVLAEAARYVDGQVAT